MAPRVILPDLRHQYDASRPPGNAYPGTQAFASYLGREGFTPHIPDLDEWNDATNEGDLRCLGIWTPDFSSSPQIEAKAAADAAKALGWKPELGRFITLDGEVSERHEWIREWGNELYSQHGFDGLDYRSLFAQLKAPSGLPEWTAHFEEPPPGSFTPNQIALQYAANLPFGETAVDLSVFGERLWVGLGRGVRHHDSGISPGR